MTDTTNANLVRQYLTWSPEKIAAFRQTLLSWYDREGRQLPWREDQEPYHILISEIMLQQTQVQTVIPYYHNFLQHFPTVQALATAPEEELLQVWSGLGYYSRARHLQQAAQQIVQDYAGVWPQTAAGLADLSGVGPYTAGAIASISFKEPVPAVDGNAYRVFARLLKIDLDIAKPQTRPIFTAIIQQIIDLQRPGDFNQAIMDLGSSYLTAKNSDPAHSPVRDFDASWQDGTYEDYPVKTKKAKPVVQQFYALALKTPQGWLLVQRPSQGLLARLWLFPLVAIDQLLTNTTAVEKPTVLSPAKFKQSLSAKQLNTLQQLFQDQTGIQVAWQDPGLKVVKHTFTHRQWQLKIITGELAETPSLALIPGKWFTDADLVNGAIPTVQRKIMQELSQNN
ncbi:A/G-specific adenine glycosylase [Lapidilactobacillus wuchangensis]|uniref:A/G-specific adenine glycosylase n=1 Tax=Lapidilactobacillus wuchangensis TaxID=2486001 RepID=UPI000F79B11D|nr:A/G-specific adenine glycosylase [Lapidilactobacillus wuchangensis]